jgi:hypothetical protein
MRRYAMGGVGVGEILGVQVGYVQRVALGFIVIDGVRVMVGVLAGAAVSTEMLSGVSEGSSGDPTGSVGWVVFASGG